MLRAWRRHNLALLTALCLTAIFLLTSWPQRPPSSSFDTAPPRTKFKDSPPRHHPIDDLIDEAHFSLKQLLGKRSLTLEQATSRYRERRGRHPPPGFDAWFAAAKERNAIVVEDFFDTIHHGINPFWAIDPAVLRRQAHGHPEMIRVRGGKVSVETEHPWQRSLWQKVVDTVRPAERRPPWIHIWAELVGEMAGHLPDLDMAVNTMDETRILVPWEKMEAYAAVERESRKLLRLSDAETRYSGLADVDGQERAYEQPQWIRADAERAWYWDYLRAACPPGSLARNVSALASFEELVEYPSAPMQSYTYKGYIQNFTAARDACEQPHLRGMHGTFVESVSMATLTDLFPLFGQTKLRQNNELLIPGAAYLTLDPLFSGGGSHGTLPPHRWVQMMNGSLVGRIEAGEEEDARTFKLLPADVYAVPAQERGELGRWLSRFANVGVVDLLCFPEVLDESSGKKGRGKKKVKKTCDYTSPFFSLADAKPMSEQYGYKYLPDIDGNSFSGRWRAFLHSTSLPLKATIYDEWHDDRLVPWVHFVPFDNSFMDIYGVMDYFLDGRDHVARRIAEEGHAWAGRVHRGRT